MGFSLESGYVPTEINTMMLSVMENINIQFGTEYTESTFVGTNFYKYFYAAIQRMQENEIKMSEIFLRLQEYFEVTNERISRPVVTSPGLIEALADAEYLASVKPMVLADAGTIHVCVDADDGDHATGNFTITDYTKLVSGTDDSVTVGATVFTAQVGAATLGTETFQAITSNAITAASLAAQINAHATAGALVKAKARGAVVLIHAIHGGTAGNAIALAYTDNDANVGATKSGVFLTGGVADADYTDDRLEICEILESSIVGGVVSVGTESESIVLSNGQSFDFKFNLPFRVPVYLELTITTSDNNQHVIDSPEEIKETLMANIAARYGLGKNFEPQRYYSVVDAPWASDVQLRWSDDAGSTWHTTVFTAEYDDLFEILLANITVVEV